MTDRDYAAHTKVPVHETIAQMPGLLARYDADRFQHMTDGEWGYFIFALNKLEISFSFPLPNHPQERKAIYRQAQKSVHMKLQSIKSGIESPAQAFMAHILKDGQTLFDRAREIGLLPAA